jgi:hypothetical protein
MALFGPVMCANDITIPLEDGKIVIRDAHFIRVEEGSYIPKLSFKLQNRTSSTWWEVKLHFDITGLCNGTPRHWSVEFSTSVVGGSDEILGPYSEIYDSLVGEVDGCHTEIIKATLGLAYNGDRRVLGTDEATKEAADAARRKRLAAEQKRKQAEADARYATMQAEKEGKAAEERRKIRAACSAIYQTTADTKLKDLTVKEEQQVRACQALNLYPPH